MHTRDLSLGLLGAVVLSEGRCRDKHDKEPKYLQVEHRKRTGA